MPIHSRYSGSAEGTQTKIAELVKAKLRRRSLTQKTFFEILNRRLNQEGGLEKAKQEWKRYLPVSFQKTEIADEILRRSKEAPKILFS